MTAEKNNMVVRSVAFSEGGNIPVKYSCEGENINPPLTVEGTPDNTESLALIMEDPDAPNGTFDHWVAWNILPNEPIVENSVPGTGGKNSHGKTGYAGPCPPKGPHRYFFKVFALDVLLDLAAAADKQALDEAMKGHILASAHLMAYYKKRGASL